MLWHAQRGADAVTSFPFPHVTAEAITHPDVYEELARDYPPVRVDSPANNLPLWFNVDQVWDMPLSPLWRRFMEYHTSSEFLASFVSVFRDEIEREYPGLTARIARSRVVRRHENGAAVAAAAVAATGQQRRWRAERGAAAAASTAGSGVDGVSELLTASEPVIVMDCQFRWNTPVTAPSRVIAAHLDNPFKLYVGLFYVPEEATDAAGGDLLLFERREGTDGDALELNGNRFVVNESALREVRVVRYGPNRGVVFLNTNRSIHSVTPRGVTPLMRRMITVSASFETPLFEAGMRKDD